MGIINIMGATCNACDGEDRAKAELSFEPAETVPKILDDEKHHGFTKEAAPVDPIQEKYYQDSKKIITGISDYIGSQQFIADGIIDGLQRHFFGKSGKWTADALWPNYQVSEYDLELEFCDWTRDEDKSNKDDLHISRGFKNASGAWSGRKISCIFAIDEEDADNELI